MLHSAADDNDSYVRHDYLWDYPSAVLVDNDATAAAASV